MNNNLSSPVKPLKHHSLSWVILGASALTLLLYLVPLLYPLAYPFLLLSTLVHEMGHGVAAILVGGKFDSFMMWSDGSGVANIRGNFGALAKAFVSAAGLLGPALLAGLLFAFIKSQKRAQIALASLAIIFSLSILLVVRNLFGAAFVGLFAGLCFWFSLGSLKIYARFFLCFICAQLSLSVFSRSDYLFTKQATTSMGVMPSDVAQIADALFLPYWFWGGLIGIVSIGILILGIRSNFKDL